MPGRRTRQPRQPRINWGNPLTRNLAFICVGESPRELNNGLQWVPSGTTPPTLQGTPTGRAKAFTSGAATVSYLDLGATTAPSTVDIADGPCTFVGVFYANSTSGVAIAERNDGNSVNLGWLVGYALGDTAKPGLAFVREYSTANLRKSISETVQPGLNVLVVTHDGSNLSANCNIYLNGKLGTVFGNFDGSGTTGSDVTQNLFVGRNTFDTSHSHDGTILIAGAFRRQWSPAEVVSFSNNPWQILDPLTLRNGALFVSSGTVALTGVTGTGSVGTVTPNVAVGLSGVSGTGSVGTVSPTVSTGLAGVTGTGSVNSPGVNVTIGLTGVSATGSVGNITVSSSGGNVTVGLSGVSATGSVGTLGVSVATSSLPSVTGTGSVGTISPTVAPPLVGVLATGSVNNPTPAVSLGLSGVSGTGTPGIISVGDTPTTPLAGVTGTGSVGAPGVNITIGLTGVSAIGSVGIITSSGGTPIGGTPNGITGWASVARYASVATPNNSQVPF